MSDNWRRVPIGSPWVTTSLNECIVFPDDHLSVSQLGKMMGKKTSTLNSYWASFIVSEVPGSGSYRNFVKLEQLPALMHMLKDPKWSEEGVICDCVEQLQIPPLHKQLLESEEEEEVLPVRKSSRKRGREEEAPEWAENFLEQVRDMIGTQAIQAYMLTDDFQEKCREAIQKRVQQLELELIKKMRPDVEKMLISQLTPDVERKIRDDYQQRALQRFQLPMAKQLVNQSAPQRKSPPSDSDLLKGIY